MAGSVERSRSVSSMRRSIVPPCRRANSQLNRAVRAPPMWRKPVGEGAKRVTTADGTTGDDMGFLRAGRARGSTGAEARV
jgi:hypothetical protein